MGKVWVAGSINVDLVVTAERFPKPGETLIGNGFETFPGGKGANQAVAAALSGAPCSMIGRLGEDTFSQFLLDFLKSKDVDVSLVEITKDAVCGTALITVAEQDNTIIVVSGANALLSAQDVGAPVLTAGDVLVAQLETPIETTIAFFRRGREAGARSIFNGAPALDEGRQVFPHADIVVLNETELAIFSGKAVCDDSQVQKIINIMRGLRVTVRQDIIVTLGANGVLGLSGDEISQVPGRKVSVVDTTGAGDCFVGALAARLAQGNDFGQALRFANAAASIAVTRPGAGTGMPQGAEVNELLA